MPRRPMMWICPALAVAQQGKTRYACAQVETLIAFKSRLREHAPTSAHKLRLVSSFRAGRITTLCTGATQRVAVRAWQDPRACS